MDELAVVIERHPIDPKVVARDRRRAQALEDMFEGSRTNSRALSAVMEGAASSFAYATVADPRGEREQTWQYLVLAAQAAAAMFALVIPDPGEPTHIYMRGEHITLPATGPTTYTAPHMWLRAHNMAVAIRSKGLLDILLDVPTELLRQSNTPEYVLAYIDTLKLYWKQDPATLKKLQTTVDNMVITDYASHEASIAVRLYLPQMKSLYYLAVHQAPELQNALTEGIKKYKAYWTSHDFHTDPWGFIAYPFLAQAASAHSAGIPLDLDTPYLPAAIIQGHHTYQP